MARVKYTPLTSNALRALVLAVVFQIAVSVEATQISHIGAPCNGQNILCPSSADCTHGVCHCISGFVPTVDNSNCLKVATDWEGPCESQLQCRNFANAVCRGHKCECELGNHYLDGQCWVTKHLNDNCQHNEECLLQPHEDRIECSGGICKCKYPYNENESRDQCNGCNAVWSLGLSSLLLTAVIQKLLN